ncbi:3-oxoacyl-[acyl-carrier-protein] synthase III C-terminal domain-containing protein [Acidiferrobacter thiooxydans]|jgi:3-oxoacyl-[acyl-carrier-protein] synthase-3|uniref:3-oxoacyl-ACP synthase n=1 Tax=Acidiferrobacter thiooxydans TaxID=163359 RepID=A0A1C2G3R1_9GAMM|nr:3-oxoacyl-ACP synthase III family protein [Acidiferrobacter thiooxydans]MDA8120384.1 3-oxoacyl-ACP synthase III family protein [Gammaproteobacteria bacterium]RCN56193.1 3-oxoacyl-ACP synthase [Acidiferrobacter thiooxydans]UEN98514.1 3-oxoacyl-ACP synthase III family protein [Acidiferrobacter thiooxydans]
MTNYINGLAISLPGLAVDNQELAKCFSLNEEWINLFLGNRTRHFGTNLRTGEQTHSLCDMATDAALRALADAGIARGDIDFVILATATPDRLMPATVNEVATQLQLRDVQTYQLQSGCSGAIQALDLANVLLQSGRNRCGLVIGADACNKFIDPAADYGKAKSSELINYALFGDGAGAVVLSSVRGARQLALSHVHYTFTDRGWAPGQVVEWRGSRAEQGEMLREDYKAIEAKVPVLAEEVLRHLLGCLRASIRDVQWFLPPQLSGRMTQQLVDRLGLPESRAINCVADTGNNGNALAFFQLARLADVIEPGQRAVAIAIESSRWLRAGFILHSESV